MRGGAIPSEATGIAQDIVSVLNKKRSPLSFRLQPLVLHLDTIDVGDASWRGDGGSDLVLVARREEFVPTYQGPDTDTREEQKHYANRTNETMLNATAAADGEVTQEVREKHPAETVVAQEELGRSYPFTVHSKATLVSGSIKIPSEALVTDVQKGARGRNASAKQRSAALEKGNDAATRGSRGQQKMTRVVLELIQETAARAGETGSALSGTAPFERVKSQLSSGGGADEDNDAGSRGCRVLARAVLDPAFLRRTIASHRSVSMIAVPEDVRQPEHETQEKREPPSCFARLDIAGHAVSARPGLPHIRLEVLECQNLKQADVLGKSDPCVMVFWNGQEIGRTPIARDDLNPVFVVPTGVFRLPLVPLRIASQHDPSAVIASDEERQRLRFQTSLAPWMKYAPELRLEVWDMDRDVLSRKWKKGELLGALAMCEPSEIVPVLKSSSTEETTRNEFGVIEQGAAGVLLRLAAEESNCSGCDESPAAQVSAGVIIVKMTVEDASDETDAWAAQTTARPHAITKQEEDNKTFPGGGQGTRMFSSSDTMPSRSTVDSTRGQTRLLHRGDAQEEAFLGVRCLDARGLPLESDAYCRVFWNRRQVGKTSLASEMVSAHHFEDIDHHDDTTADRGGKSKTRDSPSPAVSASQRNPVWWKPYPPLAETIGDGPNSRACGRSNINNTVIVPLYEQSKGDELTLEVFDGRHRKGCAVDTDTTACKPGEQCSDAGGSRHNVGDYSSGGQKTEQRLTDERFGPQSHRRDIVGRSLGSVTIRGETLLCPPQGRIDLLLSPPPRSSASSNKNGGTLSISLQRMPKYQEAGQNATAAQQKTKTTLGIIQQNDDMTSTLPPTLKKPNKKEHPPLEEAGHQPKRWLRLHLEGAQLKHGLDLSGTSDPFCTVYVNRVWHKETRVCWGTLGPRWDQWIEIEVCRQETIEGFLQCPEIRVEVWDKDAFSADDFIGEATLFLHENEQG